MTEQVRSNRMRPAWAIPCYRFAEYMLQVQNFTTLTNHGIRHVINVPKILEIAMPDTPSPQRAADEETLAKAKEIALLAESEITADFPLLHSHAVMGIWGALEAMIEDLAVSWIDHNPAVLNDSAIAKIRIPFAEFQGMEQADRLRFLVTELQRDLRVDLKSGATKFESLLRMLGLGGPVDERVRNTLFEVQQLRNVFAHRGGNADRKFVTNCPQFKYSVGDMVQVDSAHYALIFNGLSAYNLIIINRCRMIDGARPVTIELPGFEGALEN